MLDYRELPECFICLSTGYSLDAKRTTELLDAQLGWNLSNLGYKTVETMCTYTYYIDGQRRITEDTVFVLFTTTVLDVMHLATRHNQPAILVKDPDRFVLIETGLGRVLDTFSLVVDTVTLQDAFASYFNAKHQLDSNVDARIR